MLTKPRRQLGLASVEVVLVLPVFLALFVLMIHLTRSLHIKEETVTEARTTAWRNALFNTTCLGLTGSDFGAEVTVGSLTGIPSQFMDIIPIPGLPTADGIVTRCPSSASIDTGEEFLKGIRNVGNDWKDPKALTQVLDDPKPGIVTGQSSTGYEFFPYLGDGADQSVGYSISTVHAVDAQPMYHVDSLQIGYDNYMKQIADSTILLPTYFPCASGPASSAEKGSCQTSGGNTGAGNQGTPPGLPDYEAIEEEEKEKAEEADDGG